MCEWGYGLGRGGPLETTQRTQAKVAYHVSAAFSVLLLCIGVKERHQTLSRSGGSTAFVCLLLSVMEDKLRATRALVCLLATVPQ